MVRWHRTGWIRIAVNRARMVILDFTGVPDIDADVITELTAAIESARLMDARAVLAGFTEPVADALTSRGEASPTQR